MKKYSTTSRVLCNKFPSLNILLQIVLQTCNANSRTKPCISQPYYDNPQSVYLCPTPLPPHTRRHQSGQLVYVPSPRVCFKSQRSRDRYPVRPHTFVPPSADSSRAVVSFWRKYVHKVLVNRLGGLSLPRKRVGKLTDCPDKTIDVYHGRKTT